MSKEPINVGMEWVIDAEGCSPSLLGDCGALARILDRAVAELGLTAVGDPVWHIFPGPGGVTGMLLLSESHLVCHTFPEYGIAAFNLYCCRARPEWPWAERLAEMLGAGKVSVRTFERGAASSRGAASAESRPR